MKKLLWTAMIGVFVISMSLAGCGRYVRTKEFTPEYNNFKTENTADHDVIKGQVSDLDKKVDEQKTETEGSIEEAKSEAIAASEQGDADTISSANNFAKEQDNALRSDLEKEIDGAKDEAQEFSKSEAQKLREEISKVNRKTKQLAKADSLIKNNIETGVTDIIETTKEMTKSPEKVIVYFASGKVSLNAAVKEMLDTTAKNVKGKGTDWSIKVVGHADTRPVLSGKYRSNWDLSYARAESVKDYLVEKGITNKIQVVARGHTEPVASPNALSGKKENRRVEIVISPPKQ